MAIGSPHLLANGDIRPARFVKLTYGDGGVAKAFEADANESPIGISQEGTNTAPIPGVTSDKAAEQGQGLQLHVEGEECLLELGGTVAVGNFVKSDADGKGVAAATTGTDVQYVGATALESGVAGNKIRVKVQLMSHRPAIS